MQVHKHLIHTRGKTPTYLVSHGGGSCRKSLRLHKHLPEIASAAAIPCRKSPLTSSVYSKKLKYLLLPSLPPFYRTSLALGTETSQLFAALPTRVPHAQGSPSALTFPLAPTLRRFNFSIPLLFEPTTFLANGRHAWVLFSLTPRAEWQARTGQFSITLRAEWQACTGRFSITPRAERQARIGLVFNHPLCRTTGTHGSCFQSPLVPNGKHAWVLFSLTPHAERQARTRRFSITRCAERQARTGQFSITHRTERQARTGRFSNHPLCRTAGTHGTIFNHPSY
ncbi:unnamed protein product [Prunus armeniaca]